MESPKNPRNYDPWVLNEGGYFTDFDPPICKCNKQLHLLRSKWRNPEISQRITSFLLLRVKRTVAGALYHKRENMAIFQNEKAPMKLSIPLEIAQFF
jgi:hypothetical protein